MKGRSNKGSGLGVILFGITLLLILLFTAVNIVNSKVIENGYISLRDAVQSASSGSVIHLLTTNRDSNISGATKTQNTLIQKDSYDIYLQLALGYLINRNETEDSDNDTIVQTGEINNFIKLDHQKVVNSTMALLEDAVIRRGEQISNTNKYKVMMFFIEPYQQDNGKKFFNIIGYGNGEYNTLTNNISENFAYAYVDSSDTNNMKTVYNRVQNAISDIVNCKNWITDPKYKNKYETANEFNINLNAQGSSDIDGLVREMETYPHYLIVVKDFALPTLFDGEDGVAGDTSNGGNVVKSLFTSLSGDGTLETPMCALNTGKIQRQNEDAGWSHK